MDFFDVIAQRHSVRQFTGQPVEEAQINLILGAALTAQSSKNCHSSSFFVIKNSATMAKISLMREYGSAFAAGAPVGIMVCGDPSLSDLWVDNGAISATFIQLAATALGLGSCWVHINGRVRGTGSEENAAHYLRTVIPIPENLDPLCLIAIGHPIEGQKVVPRADLWQEKIITLP